MPRKKALIIGINYFGSKHQLNGCINDAMNIRNFLIQDRGFSPSPHGKDSCGPWLPCLNFLGDSTFLQSTPDRSQKCSFSWSPRVYCWNREMLTFRSSRHGPAHWWTKKSWHTVWADWREHHGGQWYPEYTTNSAYWNFWCRHFTGLSLAITLAIPYGCLIRVMEVRQNLSRFIMCLDF